MKNKNIIVKGKEKRKEKHERNLLLKQNKAAKKQEQIDKKSNITAPVITVLKEEGIITANQNIRESINADPVNIDMNVYVDEPSNHLFDCSGDEMPYIGLIPISVLNDIQKRYIDFTLAQKNDYRFIWK